MGAQLTHYLVTDTQGICGRKLSGRVSNTMTTVESQVTCRRCVAKLAANREIAERKPVGTAQQERQSRVMHNTPRKVTKRHGHWKASASACEQFRHLAENAATESARAFWSRYVVAKCQ